MRTVKWSKPAKFQFIAIVDYLENEFGTITVDKFINRIELIIEIIEKMPDVFSNVPEKKGVKKCVVSKRCILFYKYRTGKISIIGLYDTRMDPEKFLSV